MDFAIFDAARVGFEGPVIVIRAEQEEAFREHLNEQFAGSIEPLFVHQDAPRGTGHAVLCAAERLNRPIATCNADDFYGLGSFEALFRCLRDGSDGCAIVYRLADTLSRFGGVSRAVCRADADGFLTGVTEVLEIRRGEKGIRGRTASGSPVELTGGEPISMSLWGLRPGFVQELRRAYERFKSSAGEFRLSDAADLLVRERGVRIRMIHVREAGFGVTFAEDVEPTRARLETMIARGDYPARFGPISMRPAAPARASGTAEPEGT